MRSVYDTVIRPVVTEKSSASYSRRREYTFQADPAATKYDIKEAVERLFDVRVLKVRTLIQRSKRKTMGRTAGRRPMWKKAFVTLHPDDSIEIFEG